MRYDLPTDRLINQLVPHYLSGRKYILLLQSLVWPLKKLNDKFLEFAREKQIEANMTSQILYLEWYLNYKLRQYFQDRKEEIFIQDSTPLGIDIYHENALNGRPFTLWLNQELVITNNPDEEPKLLYYNREEKSINKVSFMVCVPTITIDTQEFVYLLSFIVNKYRIAGKTYLIKIDQQELNPNTTSL